MYIFLGKNPLNLFSLMTLSHFFRVSATVLSATPQLGKEGRTKHRLCLFFSLRQALKSMLHWTKLPELRVPQPQRQIWLCTSYRLPCLASRNGEKADEKQLQPFASFKNKKINPVRPAGVSEPSQSPFQPFTARFIALVAHETLLKVVHFNVQQNKNANRQSLYRSNYLMPIKVPQRKRDF